MSVWNMYSLKPKGDGAINVGKRVMNFCVQHPRNFFRLCLQVQGAILLYEILGYGRCLSRRPLRGVLSC